MKKICLNENIFYVGVNDRRKHLFENNWPLPKGVSYNSYLIKDTKTALIDTIEFGSNDNYINHITALLDGAPLDYLIVNHMEPDHSSMIGTVLHHFPNVKIVGNAQTHKILKMYFNIPCESILTVKDGEVLDLGEHKLSFHLIPWVHWPETMVTYEQTTATLFSCDAFGGFGTLDGSIFDDQNDFEQDYEAEMLRYYSNIVGKYSNMVQKAFDKLQGVDIKMIAPSHGLIWRGNPGKVLGLYKKWCNWENEDGVVIAYASMYGNTEQMADYIGSILGAQGIKVKTHDVSKSHVSYMLADIWKYKGLILGTCAYNANMHPMMEHLCNEIRLVAPKNKILSIFGSSTWNGAGVKSLMAYAPQMGMEVEGKPLEIMGAASFEKLHESALQFTEEFLKSYNK